MKIISTILGLAIGDALGAPFEFSDYKRILAFKGKDNIFAIRPEKWTDDTKMALALATSLIEEGGFHGEKVAKKYVEWVKTGDLRGIGLTCERAIFRLMNGESIQSSGVMINSRVKPSFKIKRAGEEIKSTSLTGSGDFCGNGTLMRCAPIGIFYRNDLINLERSAKIEATITHDHHDARDSSFVLCYYLALLAEGKNKFDSLTKVLSAKMEHKNIYSHLITAIDSLNDNLVPEEICSKLGARGTAHETLATAIYCFLKYNTFKEAVCNSILIGGDTDTRGAIVGALAGTYYGFEGIPKEYVQNVEDGPSLIIIDKQLSENQWKMIKNGI